ncbi:MAG: preprotein translocase subunit SecG [Myxococcota bacterium]
MQALIQSLHIATCLCLIAIVLLQHGKGADIGVSFGGGSSNTVFGARGAGNFLTKLTTGAAVIFMITSFTLSRYGTDAGVSDILQAPQTELPVEPLPFPAESSFPEAQPLTGDVPSGFEVIEPPTAPE